MSFLWPAVLCLVLLLPVFLGVYITLSVRRQRAAARYGNMGLIPQGGRMLGLRRHVPMLFFLVAMLILIIALARPQAVVSLPKVVGTVILAFDVSGSMAADDLKPTRMEAAKAAAQEFVERQPRTVQIGVVAFSDSGISVQAPTGDRNEVLNAIKRLKPERGTSLANGIFAALRAIASVDGGPSTNFYSNRTPVPTPTPTPVPPGTYTSGMIVLFTDGENNVEPDPLEAAKAASQRGVRIHTVGIGSLTGADLTIEGFTVHTQLDEATLKQIAALTGGAYYNAGDEEQLLKIYETITTQMIIRPEETEITSIFTGAGILVMLMGAAFSLVWFSRLP